jgi:hypothetical protein
MLFYSMGWTVAQLVEALHHETEVSVFRSRCVLWKFSRIPFFLATFSSREVHSACNRNEYQGISLGINCSRHDSWHFHCPSWAECESEDRGPNFQSPLRAFIICYRKTLPLTVLFNTDVSVRISGIELHTDWWMTDFNRFGRKCLLWPPPSRYHYLNSVGISRLTRLKVSSIYNLPHQIHGVESRDFFNMHRGQTDCLWSPAILLFNK